MTLQDDPSWLAVHFPDNTVCWNNSRPVHSPLWESMLRLPVEPMEIPGHYRAFKPFVPDLSDFRKKRGMME